MPIPVPSLRGFLLEEALAYLVRGAGYQLIEMAGSDPNLRNDSNGLRVIGRGGEHQADVLGELQWTPAFSNPVRLFVEAKCYSDPIGINEVRKLIAILHDINQMVSTTRPAATTHPICYQYRALLASTSGFSDEAQRLAFAHQISLLDMSGPDYETLRRRIEDAADRLGRAARGGQDGEEGRGASRGQLRDFRESLWAEGETEQITDGNPLDELQAEVRAQRGLLLGVSASGALLFLRPLIHCDGDPLEVALRHLNRRKDPKVSVHYDRNAPTSWAIRIPRSGKVPRCDLHFTLPTILWKEFLATERQRAVIAGGMKRQHFANISVFHVDAEKTTFARLRLDHDWFERMFDRPRRDGAP